MKKIYIITAVLATVALISCQREKSFDRDDVASNDIVFSFSNASSTRSSESLSQVESTIFSLGASDDEGTFFALEETVVDLNEIQSATRGTPVYTGNVGNLYKNDLFVHADAFAEGVVADAIYQNVDNAIDVEKVDEKTEINGWRYHYNYNKNPWPGDDDVDFYFRMPSKMNGVKNDAYTYENNTIAFDYTSPVTTGEDADRQDATVLQDLIFATRTINKSTHDAALPHGAPVLFRHALTGVKFATANYISGDVGGTKTYIKSVKFIGLRNGGHCVFNPDNTEESNIDDTDVYSSKNSFTWTPPTGSTTFPTGEFIQNYEPANYAQNVYDGSTLLNPNDTPSFFAEDKVSGVAGKTTNEWNINDQNGTMTFWFIPQQINSDDIKLEITFYIQAGEKKSEDITRTLTLRDFTKNANWQAGQLRTYVLKATEVAVTVEDQMSDDGQTKNMIQIRNMGNVPQWVRATVVAFWADDDGNAVYGYKASEGSDFVTPWSLDTEISESPLYGQFTKDEEGTVGFPGKDWVKGSDGYYYFTDIIGVDRAATTNLFATYAITTTPDMYKLNRKSLKREKISVHLEMKIVVQAILAKANQIRQNDGSYIYTAAEDYQQAWADAKLN